MNATYDALIQFLSTMEPETVTLLVEKSPPLTPAVEDALQRFAIGKYGVETRARGDTSGETNVDEVTVYLALPQKLDKFELLGTVQVEVYGENMALVGTLPLHKLSEEQCSAYLYMISSVYAAAQAKHTTT